MSFEILSKKEIKDIITGLNENLNSKKNYEFNIFTLSSYGNHLENFHSDIIAHLINPQGKHREKDLLLKEFIDYLNLNGANIDKDNFHNATIKREKGRIDIAIYNNFNEVIIIENKINGAIDADEQLKRYYNWCEKKGKRIVCIVYLTLSGEKNAPTFKEANAKTINITAFSNNKKDLVNGWLIPCIGKCKNFDTASFLKQYSKLLTFLTFEKMNSEIFEKFYDLADDMSIIQDINELKKISDQLPKIRMDKLVKQIENFQPFTKSYRYRPNYMLYENYKEDDNSFKLDIWFNPDGSAQIHFWNPNKDGDEAFFSIKNKIVQIGYEGVMHESQENWIGYYKKYDFSEYKSLKKIDEELLSFVTKFMEKLNENKV